MMDWLEPVRSALDGHHSVPTFFFRDDDAGWEHERLMRLLDVFSRSTAPIDVAVIPSGVTSRIAADLRRAVGEFPGPVHIHQHGFRHKNHETNGRKSEFGPSRTIEELCRDLVAGKCQLEEMVGKCARPIFTPPWNCCTDQAVWCLRELGFCILSRDASAGAAGVPGIVERPVALDWCGRRGVQRVGLAAWGHTIADAAGSGLPFVGIMLHHAVMTDEDLEPVAALLRLLSRHPRGRLRTISTLCE